MFENLWWARDSHHCSCVSVRMHMDFFVYGRACAYLCVCVCACGWFVILIIATSQCPILGEREAGDGGGSGRERKVGGETFCHHGNHPSYEQQSQISGSPPASAALAGRRLKQHFGLETTESINSACKRITLPEWRTGSFIRPVFLTLIPFFYAVYSSSLHVTCCVCVCV